MRARFGPRRPRVGPRRPKRSELAGWGCSPDEHATAVCVFQRSETGAFERPYEQPHAMPGAIFRRACHARGDLAGRQYYRNRVNDCVQARSLFCNRAVTRPCSVAVCCGGRRAGGRRSGGPRSRSEPSPAKTDSLYHAGDGGSLSLSHYRWRLVHGMQLGRERYRVGALHRRCLPLALQSGAQGGLRGGLAVMKSTLKKFPAGV